MSVSSQLSLQKIGDKVIQNLNKNTIPIETVMNDLVQLAEKSIEEQGQVSFIQVQAAAQTFLNTMKSIDAGNNSVLNKLTNMADFTQYLGGSISNKMAEIKSIRLKYLAAYSFDAVLNSFFNQKAKQMIYVNVNESGQRTLYQVPLLNSIQFIGASGKIFVGKREMESQQVLTKLERSITNLQALQSDLATLTAKMKSNKVDLLDKDGDIVKTKSGDKVQIMKQNQFVDFGNDKIISILNIGSLNEAFAVQVLSRQRYQGIVPFLEKYLTAVDNVGSILGEDYKNFAIKSSGASAPGLQQYIDAAQMIVIAKKMYSSRGLRRVLHNAFSSNSKVLQG